MQEVYQTILKESNIELTPYSVRSRGGRRLSLVLLHCNQCSETAFVDFEQLGKVHKEYLRECEEFNPWEPKPTGYAKEVKKIAGGLRVRGAIRIGCPPRCPKCPSSNYDRGETIMNSD